MVTIPENHEIHDEKVVKRYFEGGLYAVMSTTVGEIVDAWERFGKWVNLSKYEMAGHQYLEEHYYDNGFENRNNDKQDKIKVDIYMPIALKSNSEYVAMKIEPVRVAYYREYGDDSEKVAQNVWNVMLSFAQKQGLNPKKSHIYMYNHGSNKVTEYWHEIMITIEDDRVFEDMFVQDKVFEGGRYMSTETSLSNLTNAWHDIGKWIVRNKVRRRRHQCVEEWILNDFCFPENGIRICYPVSDINKKS